MTFDLTSLHRESDIQCEALSTWQMPMLIHHDEANYTHCVSNRVGQLCTLGTDTSNYCHVTSKQDTDTFNSREVCLYIIQNETTYYFAFCLLSTLTYCT